MVNAQLLYEKNFKMVSENEIKDMFICGTGTIYTADTPHGHQFVSNKTINTRVEIVSKPTDISKYHFWVCNFPSFKIYVVFHIQTKILLVCLY